MRKETKMMMQPNCKPFGFVRIHDNESDEILENYLYSLDPREVSSQLGKMSGWYMGFMGINHIKENCSFYFGWYDTCASCCDMTDIVIERLCNERR